jgi:hypothetical protein
MTGGRRYDVYYRRKGERILTTQILDFLMTQMDKLYFFGVLVLILLSVLQLRKMSHIYTQMTRFLDKLTGYLQVVLEEAEEEAPAEEPQAEYICGEDTKKSEMLRQEQQKKMRDAQVFDAILSEIYP